MSEKKNISKKSVVQYVIIAACVVLVIATSVFIGKTLKDDSKSLPNVNPAQISEKLFLDSEKYEYVNSGIEGEKIYAQFDIGNLNPKRFIAGNYINTTFYSLYENGYGYQYNSSNKTNEKNSFASELTVLDMKVKEAYWLEYNSQKLYMYFVDNDGSYTAIVSNYAF